MELPYDPAILLLGKYLKEVKVGLEQIFVYQCYIDCSMVACGYGTLLFLYGRFNLDPFDHYTDEQIWDVLERTFLSMTVSSSKTRFLVLACLFNSGACWSFGAHLA